MTYEWEDGDIERLTAAVEARERDRAIRAVVAAQWAVACIWLRPSLVYEVKPGGKRRSWHISDLHPAFDVGDDWQTVEAIAALVTAQQIVDEVAAPAQAEAA